MADVNLTVNTSPVRLTIAAAAVVLTISAGMGPAGAAGATGPAGSGLTAANITALGAGVKGTDVPTFPALDNSNALKKFHIIDFAAMRTPDLPAQLATQASDLLQLYNPTTQSAYSISAGAFSNFANGVINVKSPAYGAKGDCQEVRDAYSLSGVLQSPSGLFVASDVGKMLILQGGTITSITAYTNANKVTIANTGTFGSSGSPIGILWGTDDTAAIAAALLASAPRVVASGTNYVFAYGAAVFFPPGAYLSGAQLQPTRTTIFGYGGRISYLVRKPDGTTNPTLYGPGAGQDYMSIVNFGVYGAKLYSGSNATRGVYMNCSGPTQFSASYPYWSDMWVWECSSDGFVQQGQGGGVLLGLQILNCAQYGYKTTAADMDVSSLYINSCSAGGLYCTGGNNNYQECKISYNGQGWYSGAALSIGCNIYEAGSGNSYTGTRLQECYTDNFVLDGAINCTTSNVRIEDTGDILPVHGYGNNLTASTTRACLRMNAGPIDCKLDLRCSFAIPYGSAHNDATHAFFSGASSSGPTYNKIEIELNHDMLANSTYYAGGTAAVTGTVIPATTGAYAPKIWAAGYTLDTTNRFTINGALQSGTSS